MPHRRPVKKPPLRLPPKLPEPTARGFINMAHRSTKLRELQLLWRNAFDMELLTPELKAVLKTRAAQLKKAAN